MIISGEENPFARACRCPHRTSITILLSNEDFGKRCHRSRTSAMKLTPYSPALFAPHHSYWWRSSRQLLQHSLKILNYILRIIFLIILLLDSFIFWYTTMQMGTEKEAPVGAVTEVSEGADTEDGDTASPPALLQSAVIKEEVEDELDGLGMNSAVEAEHADQKPPRNSAANEDDDDDLDNDDGLKTNARQHREYGYFSNSSLFFYFYFSLFLFPIFHFVFFFCLIIHFLFYSFSVYIYFILFYFISFYFVYFV
jgi:hypothetical protein